MKKLSAKNRMRRDTIIHDDKAQFSYLDKKQWAFFFTIVSVKEWL